MQCFMRCTYDINGRRSWISVVDLSDTTTRRYTQQTVTPVRPPYTVAVSLLTQQSTTPPASACLYARPTPVDRRSPERSPDRSLDPHYTASPQTHKISGRIPIRTRSCVAHTAATQRQSLSAHHVVKGF
jgi:hypothetical protein